MKKITNILLGMTTLFILGIMTVPAFADSNTDKICKDSHVPVERTNGKVICLIKETAESTVERFGWSILSGHQAAIKHDESLIVSEDTVPTDDSLTIELHLDDTISVRNDSQTESPDTAHNVSDAILPNIPTKEPEQQDPNDPCYGITVSGYPYKAVEPITYSMTGIGILEKLCVQPDYKWYDIYLDTYTKGSITLEIPKNVVDLKQYDYIDCHRDDFETRGPNGSVQYSKITSEQIAQTDESRTIKFTYDEPVTSIISFGVYAIIDGVDYSDPNFCIKQYEEDGHDPAESLPKPPLEFIESCPHIIELEHTITDGTVTRFCTNENGGPYQFWFYLANNTLGGSITLDVPYDVFHPQHDILDDVFVIFSGNQMETEYVSVSCYNREYQTFTISYHPDTRLIEVYYPHGLGGGITFDPNKYMTPEESSCP